MANPIVVEVTRGPLVESRHRGAGAVVDSSGALAFSFGDVERPVFPRSAVKAFQALPLIESGAADKLGLSEAEIALACASHSGEEAHVAGAAAMIGKAGAAASALACGAHWPLGEKAARALARSGAGPSALHNNCSGKHAGFICLACASGWDLRGYETPSHPVQRAVREAIEGLTGAALGADVCAVDGCSIPTYAVPLRALALGFARFATGEGLAPARRRAARRIRAAVAAHPLMVAGEGRFDTDVMTLLGERAFTKTGAEGVFCAALPKAGLGLAVKADDGATRAAQVMIAALIAKLLPMSDAEGARFEAFASPTLRNWNGLEVGRMWAAGALGSGAGGATARGSG
ncbi:MAG TPA: asparaginase [Roseiarcus sp.]|nr:asparaginase [Roseiarcus sp.]